jgi:hypothetical protein
LLAVVLALVPRRRTGGTGAPLPSRDRDSR